MQVRLTLDMDADVIAEAKSYAQIRGKSLSQIVSDYFVVLTRKSVAYSEKNINRIGAEEIPPITKSLWGLLEGIDVDRQAYRDYLLEKYL